MKDLLFIISFVISGLGLTSQTLAATADDLVDQMLREQVLNRSFDANKANQLCGQWSDAKKILIEFAKSGNQEKIDLAHDIVSHRYSAWETNWTSTVREMAEEGITRPIEGMAPTGSWKQPLAYQHSQDLPDQIKFIIDGANADIDATFFGNNPNVAEEFVERASINWARTTGGLPDGPVDFNKVNEVLKNSEITPFPRHPDGKMSAAFKKKFPEIVRESYPGPQGQRALEQNYLIKSNEASIVKYNKAGQLVTDGDHAQIIQNQPAANLIEDVNKAKFTRIEQMRQLSAEYTEKFAKKFTTDTLENQKITAKTLQRMIKAESRLQGVKASHHPLYNKAVGIKEALREGNDALVKVLLEGQSLDDFMKQAKTEMSRINTNNQARLTQAADDAAAAAGLSPAMRGLMLLGYGAAGADAFLKAKTGEGMKEITKAVTASLVADLTASAIGPALGGAATRAFGGAAGTAVGVGTGFGAAIAAYMATHAALEWTEDGINNMLGGYKVDASMKSIFLNKNTIEKFLTMTPEEIKKIVDREWDQQDQWGGAYLGKSGDPAEQLKRKEEIILKAMEAQNRINQSRLREKIVSEIVQDELARLVDRVARGELSAEELAEARERFKGNEQGLWEWAFGSPLDKLLEERLKSGAKYEQYRILLERLGESPAGKPGLWERLFGEDRQKARERADAIYIDLIRDQKALEDLLASFDSQMQIFKENLNDGKGITEPYDLLAGYVPDMESRLKLLGSLVAEYLKEDNLGYGGLDDLTKFYARRSEVTAMLLRLRKEVEDRKRQFEKIRLMGDRLVGLQRLKKLEQDIQALETQCRAEEGARKSAEEAWRLSQTIEASVSQVLTEYRTVLDNAGAACADIQELSRGIIESANNATRWAVSARLANEVAVELLQTCPVDYPIDVNNVSSAIKGAMLVAKNAAEEFTLANEGSDVFRAMQAGARDGIARLGTTRDKLSKLEIDAKAVDNYLDSANNVLEKMKDPGKVCVENNKSALRLEIIALAREHPWIENAVLDALISRLDKLAPRALSKTIAQDIEKARKTIDLTKSISESGKIEELVGNLTKCDQAEPPIDKLLFAMEAMSKIEGSYNWLNNIAAAKANCLVKLEQHGKVAKGIDTERFVKQLQITGADPCIIKEVGQACGPFNLEIWYSDGTKADHPLESIIPKLNQATGMVEATEEGVTDEFHFNIEWQLDKQGQVAKGKEPKRTVDYLEIKGPDPCVVITDKAQDCGPFVLHIWYSDGHEAERTLKNVKPKPKQAVGSVVASEGTKTAKKSFKILWVEEPSSMVDPMVSGYIDVPRPSKSARPGECIEFDLTNPACFPGGGVTKTGPTPAQIARALQLGEQRETQPGTEPEQPGGAVSGQPGQLIPPGYAGRGEQTEKAEETTAQLWPPGRPRRGGVEEFVEGPLIPGREPAAKPPAKSQVAAAQPAETVKPSTPAQQPVPAQQPTPEQKPAPGRIQTEKWTLVQTLTIPWHKDVYTQTLKEHTNYRFVFSGVMSPWPEQKDGMDAAYCYRKDTRQRGCQRVDTHQYLKLDTGMYYGTSPFTANRTIQYNPKHVYEGVYSGHGKPAKVKFCCFSDPLFSHWAEKTGSLALKIYEQRFQ